ncbi:MAG TPA: MFS transporter, partial [Ktedonobacterales bacterium]
METRDEGGTATQMHASYSQMEADAELAPSLPQKPSASKSSFLAPLRLANFRNLVAGQTVSRLGDAFYFLAIPWLVLNSTSSPIALSVVLGVSSATLGISTLAGGVLADRYGPRTLMIASDIARLLIITGMATWALLGAIPFWAVVGLTGLLGLATGLFYPASSAMPPYLVQSSDLQAANSFDQIAMQVSNFVGPGIAGAVLGATRLALGFVIDAATFVVSVISLIAIRMPSKGVSDSTPTASSAPAQSATRGGLSALGEGFRYLGATPFLLTMVLLSLMANFAANGLFEVGLPLLLKQWVGLSDGPRAQGFILGGYGFGAIAGALVAGFTGHLRHKPLIAILLLLPSAVLLGWVPFTHDVYLTTGLFVAFGVLIGCTNVMWITLIQRGIPKNMLGRIMSLAMLGSFIGTPLSIFAYGALATVVPDVSLLFLAGAALFGIAGLIALTQKVMW